jgi:hypothetical protein
MGVRLAIRRFGQWGLVPRQWQYRRATANRRNVQFAVPPRVPR